MYTNASNNTPSYTHVSSYVVWRVHPLGVCIQFLCTTYPLCGRQGRVYKLTSHPSVLKACPPIQVCGYFPSNVSHYTNYGKYCGPHYWAYLHNKNVGENTHPQYLTYKKRSTLLGYINPIDLTWTHIWKIFNLT